MIARKMLAALFAALLAFGAVACETDDTVEDPLLEDGAEEPTEDPLEEPTENDA